MTGSSESSDREISETSPAKSTADVDVEKLADRVYRLMIGEARLELARRGQVINRRES